MSGVNFVTIKFDSVDRGDIEPYVRTAPDDDRIITEHCILQELLDILQYNDTDTRMEIGIYGYDYILDVYNVLTSSVFDGYSVCDVAFNDSSKLLVTLEKD